MPESDRREELRQAASRGGTNFAGKYTVLTASCGMLCVNLWIVDAKAGRVYDLPFVGVTDGNAVIGHVDLELGYRPDSSLFWVKGCLEVPRPNGGMDDGQCGIFYYRLEGSRLVLLRSVPVVPQIEPRKRKQRANAEPDSRRE